LQPSPIFVAHWPSPKRCASRAALLLLNLGIVLSFMGRFEEAKATDAPYEVEIVDYH